jgi:hypothetical protein
MVDLTTKQRTFNAECFVNQIITPLADKNYTGGRNPHASRIRAHLDHCHGHLSKSPEFFGTNNALRVGQPLYSQLLVPSDFGFAGI